MTGDDYRALREGLGAHRLARDVLSVGGPDAAAYLQSQCSQDLDGLAVGAAVDSLLLEPDGKLTALVRVTRVADDRFVVDVDGGFGDAVAARLARFKLRSKLAIEPLDWPAIALRGPRAADVPPVAGGELLVLPFAWNGVAGSDLLGPGAEAVVADLDELRWCDDEAWEAVRIEAGIPTMGRELDGRTIAAEAGLGQRTVSFTKGCYTGQELVARLDARGNRVARRLCGIVLDTRATEPGGLVGADLTVTGKVVGAVTSAAWCPGVGAVAGLAYVHRSVDVGATVDVGPTSGEPVSGRVVTLPMTG
ncbi:MAG TPA: glycine cleavage T C-terminal barrel domain-containing protein [Acidimicrobiales bacterium]